MNEVPTIKNRPKIGLDRISDGESKAIELLRGKNIGLVAHPASIDRNLKHAFLIFAESKDWQLKALFGPQHGWLGDTQDNMIEWEGDDGESTGIPLYSLYGEHRTPTVAMLDGLDTVVVDLQDVGCRVYTFVQTLFLIMQACEPLGIDVIVLDRPNPIGNTVEGPVLDPNFATFVGFTPIPLRHGLTIGELARYYQNQYFAESKLFVIDMVDIDKADYFDDTKLPWVFPSPNMPTVNTAVVYPGAVLFEATNVSEGRGTTLPFELIGADGLDADALGDAMNALELPGVGFRPLVFTPTFHKFTEKQCGGVQYHVDNRQTFQPVLAGLTLIHTIKRLWPGFAWLDPPYEYEYEKMPIDILVGTDEFRLMVDKGCSIQDIRDWLDEQTKIARKFHYV